MPGLPPVRPDAQASPCRAMPAPAPSSKAGVSAARLPRWLARISSFDAMPVPLRVMQPGKQRFSWRLE